MPRPNSTRYVVMVKPPDDHPGQVRIFGTFKERHRAYNFAAKVHEAVGKAESADPDEMLGWAYVREIEPPSAGVRAAQRWATRGER